MTLTYGSLFAGVGGFDMGMEQAGYEPVFQVEWDKNCQKILHHHWPTVPKWGDVCDVNGADLPPCDVLIFGSPCQDLSVAGKRAGLQDGDRSSMFFEAVRIIKEMRDATNSIYPRATIWENVPGALSSNKGADFGVVLSSMADIGAITQEYAVLDAQYFGVPQRRRRIFLVSIFDPAASERCPDPLLPVIQGSRGDFAKGRKARKDATQLAEAGFDAGGQWWDGQATADCLTTTSNEQRMPDKNRLQAVIVPDEIVGALCARDYKGVGNQYVEENKLVVQEAVLPVAYSIREDAKANNFSATETDTALCLSALIPSPQSHHAQIFIAEPQPPYVFDGTRHDDFRMDTETVPTLKQRMGTGGGQVPMLAFDPEIIGPLTSTGMSRARGTESVESNHILAINMLAEAVAYDEYNNSISETHHAIRAGTKQSTGVIHPIAYEEIIGFASLNGFGDIQDSTEVFPVLRTTSLNHAVAVSFAYDALNDTTNNIHQTLRATQGSNGDFVAQPSSALQLAVRRLTPLECERLMGWPDDHTRWTADSKEQADTSRYKQCGNGVASPVAKFVGEQLRPVLETE